MKHSLLSSLLVIASSILVFILTSAFKPSPAVKGHQDTKACVAPGLPGINQAKAKEVLVAAEEIRSISKAEIAVDLRNEAEHRDSVYDMKILRSTERRAYIEFLAPEEERGRRMLAKGQSYWSTFPDSKRVVPISRKEMIGNSAFAIADIFQMDAEADYDPKIVASGKIGGQDALKLELKAKREDAPYDCIEYWVAKKDSFPLTAAFYGISGKHLKTMTVEKVAQIGGRLRPQTTKMVDEVVKGHYSWWTTKSMVPVSIPDSVFTKDYLQNQQ